MRPQVTMIDQQGESILHRLPLRQAGPLRAVHVAGREAVAQLTLPQLGQQQLCRRDIGLNGVSVDASGVRLQILRPTDCTIQRGQANATGRPLGKMREQCQTWNERPILGEMGFKVWCLITGAEPPFQCPAPFIESDYCFDYCPRFDELPRMPTET